MSYGCSSYGSDILGGILARMPGLDNTTQEWLFSVIGLPLSGAATFIYRSFSLYGSSSTAYDLAQITAQITAQAQALTSDQVTRVVALKTTWDSNNLDSDETEIYTDGGTAGVLSHSEKLRRNIRAKLDDIFAINIPPEGFIGALKKELNSARSGNRLVK